MNNMTNHIKSEKGSITILMALIIVVLLGFGALVVDFGVTFAEKTKLDSALDAAALAGAQDLTLGSAAAITKANLYLTLNNIPLGDAIIEIGDGGKSIRVSAARQVKHYLAPAIGISSTTIRSTSKAMIGPVGKVTGGLRPVAVEDFPFVYGQSVTLKEGGGDGYNGNYGAVAYDYNGANVFQQYLLYGYPGALSVGQIISTEPGNMAGAVTALQTYISGDQSIFSNYSQNSARLWTIPVVDTLVVDGRADVEIVSFAQFFVENASKVAGEAIITGRFIKFVALGDIDVNAEDRGVYAIKLSR